MDKLQKKHKIRDALKNVIYQSLNEALQLIEKYETEENVEKLNSYRETLKRKIGAVKTLEDEIIELEENAGNLVKIIEESNTFEIECKAKLNIINRHTQKNVERKREKKENNNNVKLPKLEITKFDGDAIKWNLSPILFMQLLIRVPNYLTLKSLITSEVFWLVTHYTQ